MHERQYNVLVIDDDQDVLNSYQNLLTLSGYKVKGLLDPTQAPSLLTQEWPGVIILDMYMPQMHGLELLALIRNFDNELPVIVITGHGDIPMAVEAVKLGAVDFLEKPIKPTKLLSLIAAQLEKRQQFIARKHEMNLSIRHELVGRCANLESIRQTIAHLAILNNHVTIFGASGSGRRTAANLIHQLRHEKSSPFVYLQGSQIESLAQLEILYQQAEGGSLLIHNPQAMPEQCQSALIERLIAQERFGKTPINVIAVFDQAVKIYIEQGLLLPELYYILSQGMISMPTLHERKTDIPTLFRYFLKQSCRKLGKSTPKIDNDYLSALTEYSWPGNVRELRNVAELYAIGIVKLAGQDGLHDETSTHSSLESQQEDHEKQVIQHALFLYSGRVGEAADFLQVPRKRLYLRMKKYGLEKDEFKPC